MLTLASCGVALTPIKGNDHKGGGGEDGEVNPLTLAFAIKIFVLTAIVFCGMFGRVSPWSPNLRSWPAQPLYTCSSFAPQCVLELILHFPTHLRH